MIQVYSSNLYYPSTFVRTSTLCQGGLTCGAQDYLLRLCGFICLDDVVLPCMYKIIDYALLTCFNKIIALDYVVLTHMYMKTHHQLFGKT